MSLPKKEMAQYLKGRRPGPIVAYRIGRSVEQICNRRFLREYQKELSAEVAKPEHHLEQYARECGVSVDLSRIVDGIGVVDSCSGLDALIAAGHWADAIACLGEYVGDEEKMSCFDFACVFNDSLANKLRNVAMPESIYPGLDNAWIRWISRPDPHRLPARFGAAYLLCKNGKPQDKFEAIAILKKWVPRFTD
ncbi:MAG: hypothetical protein WB681_12150 [Candidatus Cybelea sp.]